MAEVDGARVKAKYKLKVRFMLLVFVVLVGALLEYQRLTQPLDEVAIVYVNGGETTEVAVAQPQKIAQEEPYAEESKPEEVKEPEPQQVEAIEPEQQPEAQDITQKEIPVVDNADALPEFLDMLKATQAFMAEARYSEPVLNKIIQTEPKAEPQSVEPKIFQDGKIEVYDSNKGVVAVHEEPKPETPKVEEKSVEQHEANKVEAKPQEEAVAKVEEVAKETVNDVDAKVETAKEEGNLLKEEIEAVMENEKKNAEQAENSVRERINQDLDKLEESGEEAPIVLIPGLMEQAQPNEEKNEHLENIDN